MKVSVEHNSIANRLCKPDQRDEAMAELVRLYGTRLYKRIYQLVGSESDANDVFQDALVKVLRHVQNFDGRSQFFSWLYRVVTNQSLDFLRSRKRREKLVMTDSLHDSSESKTALLATENSRANQEVDSNQAQTLLLRALALLPEQQRIVFEERYYHETSYKELADRFGKSEGGLKANYHHAVQKVTAYIKNHAEIYTS